MKPIRTYILIANGARARIVLAEGLNKPLAQVPGSEMELDLKADRELSADKPGRVHESATVTRHAIERDDLHVREKENFAKLLAQKVEERFSAGEFERLIIVAPPETMGFLRANLSEKVKGVVMGEIMKDLTKVPNPEVRKHLDELVV